MVQVHEEALRDVDYDDTKPQDSRKLPIVVFAKFLYTALSPWTILILEVICITGITSTLLNSPRTTNLSGSSAELLRAVENGGGYGDLKLSGIASREDAWQWLRHSLVSGLIHSEATFPGTPLPFWGNQFELLQAVRLTQRRTLRESCNVGGGDEPKLNQSGQPASALTAWDPIRSCLQHTHPFKAAIPTTPSTIPNASSPAPTNPPSANRRNGTGESGGNTTAPAPTAGASGSGGSEGAGAEGGENNAATSGNSTNSSS